MDLHQKFCVYKIKVPKQRRIIAEVVEGRSLLLYCDNYNDIENSYKEKLIVSTIHINLIYFIIIIIIL